MTLNDSCHKHACHDYEGDMSVLCTLLQVKCYRFPSDFRDKLWVGIGLRIFFSDRNVVPGSTISVDPGTCLAWQNHSDPSLHHLTYFYHL